MNKNIIKVIKTAVIILMTIILVFSIIVSQDEHHLQTCHEDHCNYCVIVRIAQNIVNIYITFLVVIVIDVLFNSFFAILYREQEVLTQLSLVLQNVQLNE